jgi:hypothetical protein
VHSQPFDNEGRALRAPLHTEHRVRISLAIVENYSRCVLASAISVTQGTTPSCASSTLLLTPFESLRQTLS